MLQRARPIVSCARLLHRLLLLPHNLYVLFSVEQSPSPLQAVDFNSMTEEEMLQYALALSRLQYI